jgi:cytochrome b561
MAEKALRLLSPRAARLGQADDRPPSPRIQEDTIMDVQADRLAGSLRTMHWIGVVLILIGYLTSDGMEHSAGLAGSWHVLAGLGLLLLVVPRFLFHWKYRARLTSAQPGATNRIASLVHWALLVFVVVQPLLGILAVWSEGDALPLPFTSLAIASPFAGGIGDWPGELHEVVGNLFYGVIGLHAAAALWHHFVRRDPVLRRML